MKSRIEHLFVKYLLKLMRVAFGGSFVLFNLHDNYYFAAYSGGVKKNLCVNALAVEAALMKKAFFVDGDICDLCERIEKGRKI
jgi:hypothetical protein